MGLDIVRVNMRMLIKVQYVRRRLEPTHVQTKEVVWFSNLSQRAATYTRYLTNHLPHSVLVQ